MGGRVCAYAPLAPDLQVAFAERAGEQLLARGFSGLLNCKVLHSVAAVQFLRRVCAWTLQQAKGGNEQAAALPPPGPSWPTRRAPHVSRRTAGPRRGIPGSLLQPSQHLVERDGGLLGGVSDRPESLSLKQKFGSCFWVQKPAYPRLPGQGRPVLTQVQGGAQQARQGSAPQEQLQ